MATHSSILAWKIPWTKELGGLQSMGSCSQIQPSVYVHQDNSIAALMSSLVPLTGRWV